MEGNFKTAWSLEEHFDGYKTAEDRKHWMGVYSQAASDFEDKYNILDSLNYLTPSEFREYEDFFLEADKGITKCYYYLMYRSSLDTTDSEANKAMTTLDNYFTDISVQLSFTSRVIKNTTIETLQRFMDSPECSDIKNHIQKKINNKQYLLEESVETALDITGSIYSLSIDIYDEFSALLEFEDFHGKKVNDAQIRAMRTDANPMIRKAAFDSIKDVYTKPSNRLVYGKLYQSVLQNKVNSWKLRGYAEAMTSRNLSECQDDQTINKLIDSVRTKFYPLFQKFLKLKAKNLGKDKLEYFDVFAPYKGTVEEKEYTFEEGLQIYLDAIKEFDPYFHDYSKSLFENGYVDVYPSQKKRGGAYCSSSKDNPSFVLLNWTNKFDDITTLAHELGHAIHGDLTQIQPEQVSRYTLSIAETASIFNETLLFDVLIGKVQNQDEINQLVMGRLDDLFSTIVRQISYISFERAAHNLYREKVLDYNDFNELWLKEVSDMFGDSVTINKEIHEFGWSSIPHIYHTPFYCYSYSFGNILSLSLYGKYLSESNKQNFISEYKNILSSGGSKRPKELLEAVNIDIDSDTFYDNAIKHIESLFDKISF